jgi:carbonic anhydrase
MAQLSSDEALSTLTAGNLRFMRDAAIHCNKNLDRRAEVAGEQHPFAIVLGCSDSRVPPEVIFDQRLGDIFTVRNAGNVANSTAIGSIEYAVERFGSPLLMVLGHERCGVVMATLEAVEKHEKAPGHIEAIVEAIRPAAMSVIGEHGDVLYNAIVANVKNVAASLHAQSLIIQRAVERGKLRIVSARYGLVDGRVTVLA